MGEGERPRSRAPFCITALFGLLFLAGIDTLVRFPLLIAGDTPIAGSGALPEGASAFGSVVVLFGLTALSSTTPSGLANDVSCCRNCLDVERRLIEADEEESGLFSPPKSERPKSGSSLCLLEVRESEFGLGAFKVAM